VHLLSEELYTASLCRDRAERRIFSLNARSVLTREHIRQRVSGLIDTSFYAYNVIIPSCQQNLLALSRDRNSNA